MERYNSEGILVEDLTVFLKNRRAVTQARRDDTCALCRRPFVNEAGLCNYCYSLLGGEEARLAATWLSGQGP